MKLLNGLMIFTILGASSATGLGIGYLSRGEEKLAEEKLSEGRIMSIEPVELLDETIWKDGVIDNNLKDENTCKTAKGFWRKPKNNSQEVCYKLDENKKQPSPL